MLAPARMVNAVRLTTPDMLHPHYRDRILLMGGGFSRSSGRVKAYVPSNRDRGRGPRPCSMFIEPDWMSLDALKPAPMMDTVRFELEPPGAEARTSNGQSCRTPCALALPANSTMMVTFTLNGYSRLRKISSRLRSAANCPIATEPGGGRAHARAPAACEARQETGQETAEENGGQAAKTGGEDRKPQPPLPR